MSEATKKVMRALRRDGFTVAITRGGHLKITRPDMAGFVIAPATSGTRFQGRQTKALLRRMMRSEAAATRG